LSNNVEFSDKHQPARYHFPKFDYVNSDNKAITCSIGPPRTPKQSTTFGAAAVQDQDVIDETFHVLCFDVVGVKDKAQANMCLGSVEVLVDGDTIMVPCIKNNIPLKTDQELKAYSGDHGGGIAPKAAPMPLAAPPARAKPTAKTPAKAIATPKLAVVKASANAPSKAAPPKVAAVASTDKPKATKRVGGRLAMAAAKKHRKK
jgi:hypothetical protein